MANLENIRKWTAALRSGDFHQAKYVLNDTEGYCCLGVACEVAISDGLPVDKTERGAVPYFRPETGKHVEYAGFGTFLPYDVMTWLGLESVSPMVRYNKRWYGLPELNDDGAFTFAEIADLIEQTATEFPEWVGRPIRDARAEADAMEFELAVQQQHEARLENAERDLVNA